MGITIKPSDLQFKYPKDTVNRDQPKFRGKPDSLPFNRDDIYEVVPMFEAVMDALGSDDGRVLHLVEKIMNDEMPRFIVSREEVFDYLVGSTRDMLEDWQW
jgi:hypothetical protein